MNGKILIVDDQAVMLRLVTYALEREGFVTITAQTAADALAILKSEQPDLLILDLMLPDADGIELCRRIRQELNYVSLPVIILSGRVEIEDKIEALEAGADEYVTKPVDPKEMVARVKSLLRRNQRLRQDAAPTTINAPSMVGDGAVIGCIGAKGGSGATTIAANIALALAHRGHRVIAVELRPYFGTLSNMLGVIPNGGLTQLAEMTANKITPPRLERYLIHGPANLRFLPGPRQLTEYRDIHPDQVKTLLDAALELANFVVLDLPHMPSIANRAALRRCHQVLLAVEPEPSSLEAAQAQLSLLNAWGIPSEAVHAVVVNRVRAEYGIALAEVERSLGCGNGAVIPNVPDLAARAMKTGQPFVLSAPDSAAAQTLNELATTINAYAAARA